jgi:hypothetical protein
VLWEVPTRSVWGNLSEPKEELSLQHCSVTPFELAGLESVAVAVVKSTRIRSLKFAQFQFMSANKACEL